jgi:hypothetical protein
VKTQLAAAEEAQRAVLQKLDDMRFDEERQKLQTAVDQAAANTRDLEGRVNRLDALLARSQGQSELQALEQRVNEERKNHEFVLGRLRRDLERLGVGLGAGAAVDAEKLNELYQRKVRELLAREQLSSQKAQACRDAMNAATHEKEQCDKDLVALRRKKGEEAVALRPAAACLQRNGARQGHELQDFRVAYVRVSTPRTHARTGSACLPACLTG